MSERATVQHVGSFFCLLVFLLMYGTGGSLFAQQQVQITAFTINAPYSNLISDYITQFNQRVTLMVNASGKTDIRLAGTLKSNTGVSITIPAQYNVIQPFLAQPITIQGPQRITAAQIGNLFSSDPSRDNSTIALKRDLIGNYILPEGDYEACIRAYQFNGSNALSDEVCRSFSIRSIEPPYLLLPQDKDTLQTATATYQPHQFSWTFPAGANPTQLEYVLQIAELRQGQNAYNVFESGPLFTEVVVPNASPLYILKATDPRFELGHTYAWRVKVQGKGRFEGLVNFQNKGLSTVNTFTYGPVKTIVADNLVTSSEKVVGSKPKADSGAVFTPVSGSCDCKITVSANTKLKTDLDNSQTVYIGNKEGYQLSISTLNKNGDTYSGDGTVALGLDFTPTGRSGPFIPVQVAFKDVKINTDNILIAGQVQSKKRKDIGFGPELTAAPTTPNAPSLPSTGDLKTWLLKSADEKSLAPAWKGLKDKITSEYESYKQQAVQQVNQQINGAGVATPFGYSSGVFTVAVDNILFTPTTAQYDAFSVLEVSDANVSVPLGLMGACLPMAGCQSQPVLYLLKDTDIPYTAQTLTLKGGTDPANSTYLAYKANGSDNVLNIVADVTIPDAKLVADGASVKARLVANTKDGFDNWQAKASIAGAFRFQGLDDFTFKLGNGAVYDHDVNRNADGFGEALTALQNSLVTDKPDAASKLTLLKETAWQGFFMPELSITLPGIFQKTDGKTTSVANVMVRNMMLGKSLGLTGVLNAENVINYKEGSLDGWYFSLDKIGITFFDGTFVNANANGKVGLPISDNNVQSALTYTNTLTNDGSGLKYVFNVTPTTGDINVPIWKAGLTIKESSVISVSVTVSDVLAKADLNGNITFTPDFGILPDFKLDLIDVEHLVVQSKAPYFSIGESKSEAYQKGKALVQQADAFVGKFASPQKSVGGSPFTVDAFTPVVKPGQGDVKVKAGFYFHGSMDLADMPASPKAGVGLLILANVKMDGIRPSFSYDRTELEDAQVSGQLGPLAVEGSLKFYRDSKDKDLPGNGFKGNLSTKVGSYSVVGQSIFGRGDFPYWYFYLAGSGTPGLFQIGPVTVNGLGGGLYHNMTPPKPDPNATFETQPKTDNYDYAANKGTDGLKMAMYFSVASQNILNARATIEGSMKNGELNTISVQGQGNLIGGTDGTSLLQANVLAMYDFPQKIFSLDADVKGGMSNVLEIKSAQLAVRADFKQDKYTLKIGEPTHRVQLELFSGVADATGYFMVGNGDIPDIPEPDPSIISQESMAAFKRMGYRPPVRATDASFDTKGDDNDAAGLAFGASVRAGADVDWTIFWAKFKAGAGFDVNFKRQAVVCEENPKQLIGANGWYVQGQAYAEFQGAVGVSAPFLGDVTIVDLKAAALLQAGLPSPTYFQGFVHGEAHVLGIFDGTFDLPVSIGTPCTPVANPFSNKPLFAGFNIDANNSRNVDILLNPQVTLNYPNKFRVDGINSSGEAFGHDYEIRVKTTLSPTAVGEPYYNDNKVLYRLKDAFQPKKSYSIAFQAVAYQDNDFSKPYQFPDRKGKLIDIKQDTMFSFTTGPCVGKIDERSLAYAFPYQDQAYYLPGESNSSTVRLKKAIGCLFDPKKVKTEIVITPRKSPSRNTVAPAQSVRTIGSTANVGNVVLATPTDPSPASSGEIRVPVTFDGNQLTYTMPTLPNNTDVQVQVVQQPIIPAQLTAFAQKSAQQASLYGNLYVSSQTVSLSDNGLGKTASSVVSANSSAYTASVVRSPVSKQLVIEQPTSKVILNYQFHTSRYNTLTDKLAATNVPANGSAGINRDHGIEIFFSSKEGFDGYDANDYPYDNNGVAAVNPALVNVLEQNNRWYEQTIKPLNKQWINLQDQLRKSPVYQVYNTLELIDNEHIQLVPDGQLHLFNTRVWEIVDNRLGTAKNTANWVKSNAADYHKWVDDKYNSGDNKHWWGVDHTYNTVRGWNEKGDKPNHMFHRLLIAAGDNISPLGDYNPYPFGDFNYLKININTLIGFDGMRSMVTMLPITPTLIFGYTDPMSKGKTTNIRKTYMLR